MKFLNEHTHVLYGHHPIDMNDRQNEGTAIELDLPDNFSDKAKACWKYFEDATFIFEYKNRLVVTDESFQLTVYGNGSPDAPYAAPRWECDTWEELENNLEMTYNDLTENGLFE